MGGSAEGRILIACYRPKPGRESDLHALMRSHLPRLREQGLATARESIVGVAGDGTVVEIFEWMSAEAIASAHTNAAVQAMWQEYGEVCTYVPLSEVAEASALFSELTPLR